MENVDRLYTAEYIYKAFDMGLDSGLYALEKSLELSHEDQLYFLEHLKKMIEVRSVSESMAPRNSSI